MTVKQRSPGQLGISISMSEKLRDAIDDRAASLGLTRSQYLAQLARQDIASGGPMVISSAPAPAALADAAVAGAISEVAATPAPAPVSYRSKPQAGRKKATPRATDSRKKAL